MVPENPKVLVLGLLILHHASLGSTYGSMSQSQESSHFSHKRTIYPGGCQDVPSAPHNSDMRCSVVFGCKVSCNQGYAAPNGKSSFELKCRDGVWEDRFNEFNGQIPLCQALCNPPCQNRGICMGPNQCHCPGNFEGPLCEIEKAQPCLSRPPTPRGARVYCNQTSCQVTCMPHHQFPNGKTETKLSCMDGKWVIDGTESGQVDNCDPICDPPCENGGFCLSYNQCQCPEDFKGLQCQYHASNCKPELMEFNGGYNCTGTQTSFTCVVYCPNGIDFEDVPAPIYTCDYATGTFDPMPVPDCDYGHGVQVIKTKKTVKKRYRTHVQQSGSYLNWTWVLEGNSMKHHWKSSLGRTWILDQGIQNAGDSNYQETQGNVYNEDGEINLGLLKRYTRNVQAGGWWFGWGVPQQTFPTIEGTDNEELIAIMSKHQSARPGSCLFWSQEHLRNFDGTTLSFPMSKNCPITLVREDEDGIFEVQVQRHCPEPSQEGGGYGPTTLDQDCSLKIIVLIENEEFTLKMGALGPEVFKGDSALIVPGSYSGVVLEQLGEWIFMHVDGLGFHVKWDSKNTLMIDVGESLWNKSTGLCGRHNGNPYDDFMDKNGKHVQKLSTLLTGWNTNHHGCDISSGLQSQTSCSQGDEDTQAQTFCSKLFDIESLNSCRKVLNPLPFFETCKLDFCKALHDPNMNKDKCHSISSYVIQCKALHVDVNANGGWRTPDFCPLECPSDRVYYPCGSGESDRCDNVGQEAIEEENNSICIEGCYCPNGMFYRDGSCIPKKQCPCLFNDKYYESGEEIKNDCNTCVCQEGSWKCSHEVCGRRCSVVGDPHYTTFDGKKFDFMGQCSYDLVRGSNFSIEVENVACSGSVSESLNYPKSVLGLFPSCTKSATIRWGGVAIKLKQGMEIIVNGIETRIPQKVPTSAESILVSRVSSMFIKVSLPNLMDIWWDGYAQLHVDAHGSFKGKQLFKGLCGDFNGQQKDDFTTPEGDVEQDPIIFSNRWRTNEECGSSDGNINHPCSANPERKSQAQEMCSKLTSFVFEDCNSIVDPSPFYQDCVFDLCACEHDPKDCLCPTLSFYAQTCSNKGIHIDWRQYVPECGVSCPMGQKFQACGTSCGLTCLDLALNSNGTCQNKCVEGCQCPEGMKLDQRGNCVSIQDCPCIDDKGDLYEPSSLRYQPEKEGEEICVCGHAQWDCRQATEEEKTIMKLKSQIICNNTNHEELDNCPKELAETCENMHLFRKFPLPKSDECQPRCVCQASFVLDQESGQCIKPSQCPCHHGRRSYTEGETIRKDCNACTCQSGSWHCSQNPCPIVCSAWGNSHYQTFDKKVFDFHGSCEYVLAKGKLNDQEGFQINIQNVPCGTSDVTCSKSIGLIVHGADNMTEKVNLVRGRPLPEWTDLKRINMRIAGLFTFIEVVDLGLVLQWDGANRLYVRVKPSWGGHLEGLCGNADNDDENDFRTPSGIVEGSARLFGDSWKLHKYCPNAGIAKDSCEEYPQRKIWAGKKCAILKSHIFEACHNEVPIEPWFDQCVLDTCGCNVGGDCECLCTAVAAYAQECSAQGIPIMWRSQDLCPMQCNKKSSYSSCISTCPSRSCANIQNYKALTLLCPEEPCVEGCLPNACREPNEVFVGPNDFKCIHPSSCRVKCMQKPDGSWFYEGEVVERDACRTCFCSKGKKRCSASSCGHNNGHSWNRTQTDISSSIYGNPTHDETTNENNSTRSDVILTCTQGWTSWINNYRPSNEDPNEVEIIGDYTELRPSLSGSNAWCAKSDMKKIQCRRASTHEPLVTEAPKKLPLALGAILGGIQSQNEASIEDRVQCELEQGVVCQAKDGRKCHDYEYRIYCECTSTTIVQNVSIDALHSCDPVRPLIIHPDDCHLYQECIEEQIPYGGMRIRMVEKSCGDTLMFNPYTMECDWSHNVAQLRPKCQEPSTTQRTTTTSTTSTTPEDHGSLHDCDPNVPHIPHESDCQMFYHCSYAQYGGSPHKVLKKCGPGTLFHPISMVCTWPNQVIQVKPECGNNGYGVVTSTSTTEPTFTTIVIKSTLSPLKKCEDGRELKSLVNDPNEPLSDDAFSSSSSKDQGPPASGRMRSSSPSIVEEETSMRYKRQAEVRKLLIHDIQCLTADEYNAGMTSGLFGIMSGEFYLTVCGPKACCETGHLDNAFNNWERGQTDTFDGSDIGQCDHFDIGDSYGNSVEITLRHAGQNGGHLEWIRVNGIGGTVYQCTIDEKLDDDVTRSYGCERIHGDDFNPIEEETFERLEENHYHSEYRNIQKRDVWEPEVVDTHQYLQVSFESAEPIYGVVIKGDSELGAYVTSYYVMYSWDGISYSYVENSYGEPQLFKGSVDAANPVRVIFENPIEARYVRVNPYTWVGTISLQVDILGCQTMNNTTEAPESFTTFAYLETTTQPPTQDVKCQQPMGIDQGILPSSLITVSSVYGGKVAQFGKSMLQLSSGGGWKPATDSNNEFIKVDFTDLRDLTGIQIGGRINSDERVETFRVRFSRDGTNWNKILDGSGAEKVFLGNHDSSSVALNYFQRPIRARYLKIVPLKWHKSIGMRLEVLGCYEPYANLPVTTTTNAPYVLPPEKMTCDPCPNVPFESMPGCSCSEGLFWDGQGCVEQESCPCFVGYQRYEIGTQFENEDCEECTCQSGGSTHCVPQECPPCSNPYLHPELTPQCKCLCRGCSSDSKLCPTDNICVPNEKWCDGINDCSDDERDCAPKEPTKAPKLVDTTIEPLETTAKPIVTQMAVDTTTKSSQCKRPVCAPEFDIKETEIETTDGCVVYKCIHSSKQFYCPPVFCPDGEVANFFERLPDFGFPPKVNPDRKPIKIEDGTNQDNEELAEIFSYRRKRDVNENADFILGEDEFGLEKCPKYECSIPGKTTTTTTTTTTTITTASSTTTTSTPNFYPIENGSKCTFDGQVINSFDGIQFRYTVCHHILAQNKHVPWKVSAHQVCIKPGKCQKSIQITHGLDEVILEDSFQVRFRGNEYTPRQISLFTEKNADFTVTKIGTSLVFRSRFYPLRVVFTKSGRVEIDAKSTTRTHVDGLCGLLNGDNSDDRTSPDGIYLDSSQEFGDSWQVPGSETCSNPSPEEQCPEEYRQKALRMCQMTTRFPPFNQCGHVVNFDQFTAQCFDSSCQCLKDMESGKSPDDPVRTCRCKVMGDLIAECLEKDRSVVVDGWREQHLCPSKCPPGKIHKDCHNTACKPTCDNFRQNVCASFDETKICFPGCYCPEGTVHQGQDCVPKSRCRDCVCKINQRPHKFQSFDQKDFKYAANCSYVAVKHLSIEPDFEIHFTNEPCPNRPNDFCTMAVEAKIGGHSIHVGKSIQTNEMVLYVDAQKSELVTSTQEFNSVLKPNGDIQILLNGVNVEIVYNMEQGSFVVRMPSEYYGGKTGGICGNCNMVAKDDFVDKSGQLLDSVGKFFDAWSTKMCPEILTPPTSLPQTKCLNENKAVCQMLHSPAFSMCNPLIDPTPFLEDCEKQSCLDPNFSLCNILSEYGEACQDLGVCISWRKVGNCSTLQCPSDREYHECPTSSIRTCQDVKNEEQNQEIFMYARSGLGGYGGSSDEDEQDLESETCSCPEGRVLQGSSCIPEELCNACQDVATGDIYAIGESWTSNCQSCSCHSNIDDVGTSTRCQPIECLPEYGICGIGQEWKKISDPSGDQCCPTYSCINVQMNCTETIKPKCSEEQILKKVENSQECPTFVCECVAKSDCPRLDSSAFVLKPGETVVKVQGACCPKLEIKCKRETCPIPPTCPKFYKLIQHESDLCCPEFSCEHPNACIYTSNFSKNAQTMPSNTGYGISEMMEDKKELKELYAQWEDGPCKVCLCLPQEFSNPTPECTLNPCKPPELDSNDYLYAMKNETLSTTECCPTFEKIACLEGNEAFYGGETIPTHDPCIQLTCVKSAKSQLIKQEIAESCDSVCPLGWKLNPPETGKCCGKCKQIGCIQEDSSEILELGQQFQSEDGCVTHACVNVSGTLQLLKKEVACPLIENCDGTIKKDVNGCCDICIPFSQPLSSCAPVSQKPSKTIGLVQEIHANHGYCQNNEPITNFRECQGHCKSGNTYLTDFSMHESNCKCCQTLVEETLKVVLSCEDNTYYTKEIKVPSRCHCLSCSSLQEENTKTKHPGYESFLGYQHIPLSGNAENPEQMDGHTNLNNENETPY